MNGSEPRDERNMGSIDSWIPFVSLRHPRSLSLISLPVGDGSEDERSEPSASRSLRSRYAEGMEGNDVRKGPNMTSRRNAEGTDQTVTKGLVLHPSSQGLVSQPYRRFPPSFHSLSVIVRFHTFTSQYAPQAGVTGGNATRRERIERSGNNMRRKPAVS